MRARIWIPLHVTGFWIPVWRREPMLSGSLGAGLLLEPGVVAEAVPSNEWRIDILIEGQKIDREPSIVAETTQLLKGLRPVKVTIKSPVPISAGFAVSAGIALSIALGAGLLNGMGLVEAASLAHVAEVRAGTGLGDVVAILYGRGLEARLAPGGPGVALVESYVVPRREVLAVVLGSMETREIHKTMGERLYELAGPWFSRFLASPGLGSFLREARGFSIDAGTVDEEVVRLLDGLMNEGLLEGWYAKKKVIIMVPVPSRTSELERRVRVLGLPVYRLRIASRSLEARIV